LVVRDGSLEHVIISNVNSAPLPERLLEPYYNPTRHMSSLRFMIDDHAMYGRQDVDIETWQMRHHFHEVAISARSPL
jgi:hypothetical protein